mmetsp:Transcript_15566/g.26769  ORF Transcript_15566/g.26769 Transcript_15566/m.26769 type:complete len:227 (+) Transcript_15566:35-715(+)|eukprot:CAMPEP_0196667596 /NCGR_PEP_ID=MMETSP1086-20130531/65171_1 /TAXON_ID=77921 /ORGANISM="Cyanoptyche  gloeocystis , Strain SAG4.97" /LENGTH=226 /DNA_ID=CAMNT_0042004943 /DNA_START=26 /DNA_END=706 /DNA_ORIENTATION=+
MQWNTVPAKAVQEDDTSSPISVRLNALKNAMETSRLVLHLEYHGLQQLLEEAEGDVCRLDPEEPIENERKIRWLQDVVHADCNEVVDLNFLSPECRSDEDCTLPDEVSDLDRDSEVSDTCTESAYEDAESDTEYTSEGRALKVFEPSTFAVGSLASPSSRTSNGFLARLLRRRSPAAVQQPQPRTDSNLKFFQTSDEPRSSQPRATEHGIAHLLDTYMSFSPRPVS